MSTPTVAQAALLYVAQQSWLNFNIPTPDPTWSYIYGNTVFINTFPLRSFSGPKVALYRFGGTSNRQGIGTVKQYGDTRFRLDVFGRNFNETEQMINALWTVWEADFDYYTPNTTPTVGQGYLKAQGGIKDMTLAEWTTLDDEKAANAYFRRINDLTVLLRDS